MKKRIVSFLMLVAFLTVFAQSGMIGMEAHAESLGLKSNVGNFSTAQADDLSLIRKVCNLSKSQTNSKVAGKIEDILFKATYRPTDIGGSDWVKDNHGSGITSVYDPGLDTTVSWESNAWGCFSYAVFVSRYVRGSKYTIISIGMDYVPTVNEIKSLFDSCADPGEHIRYYYKTPGGYKSVHSVVYLASDSEGFYFLSESGDGLKITVHYCTYSYFQTALRVKSGESTLKVYDTNGGKEGKTGLTVFKSDASTGNNNAVAFPKPTPRYSPDTEEYKVSYSRTLMWRSSKSLMGGNDIRYMQACLYYLGYNIDIDSWYGSGTASVVKQFQTHYGLTSDGDIGPSTWSAIEKEVANNPPPGVLTIKTQPKNVTADNGSKVKFSVSAVGTKLSYQWYYKKSDETSWTLWSGHNTASTSVTVNSSWNGRQVCCRVTDGSGKSVCSKTVVVIVTQELKITEQPKNVTASIGGTAKLSVTAVGTKLSYQWYYKKSDETSWTLWSGHNTASTSVTVNSSWNGRQVCCRVTDGSGKSVCSKTVVVTVTQELKITEQPKSQTISLGNSITVSVKAQGIGITYQWYYKKKGETSWSIWTTRTHASENVTPNATWNGIQLYCKVKNSSGKYVNSSAAEITVNTKPLKITAQPKSRSIELGNTITLSIKAEGVGLSYQWYYKKRGATVWSKWGGRIHASETVTPNASWDGIQLCCKVKDASGKTLNSNTAIIAVNEKSLKIIRQPQSAAITLGESVTVSVSAQGTGLSYQWYYKKRLQTTWSVWTGRTRASETVIPNETWDGIQIYCKVKDSSGKTVNSNIAIVVVND